MDGGSLAGKIDGEPQPPREAARIVHLLAGAMDCAHKAGVVHRDLKPANVLLTTDGAPKITDFGLAKRVQENSGQTRSGSILGSPGYMAPEQAEGKNDEVGPLSDVYALGAILYEMLTGRMPFMAPSVLETLEQVRTREPVAPVELQPGVPRDLETICLKCLQKDPQRRYDGAGLLAEDLRRFLGQEPILARRVGRLERAWRWCRRNPRLAVLGAATAAIVVAWAVSMSALAWQLKLQKDKTDEKSALAEAKTVEAVRSADEARQKKEAAYQSARVAVQRMTQTFGKVQQRLDNRVLAADATPELRALRNDVLSQLRDGMLGLTKDLEDAGATRFATLAMYQEMGDLLRRLGKGEEAMQQYQKGCDLARKIAEDQPDDDKTRANLAFMLNKRGDMEREVNGDPGAARDDYEKARALQQDIADHPRATTTRTWTISGSWRTTRWVSARPAWTWATPRPPATISTRRRRCARPGLRPRRSWLRRAAGCRRRTTGAGRPATGWTTPRGRGSRSTRPSTSAATWPGSTPRTSRSRPTWRTWWCAGRRAAAAGNAGGRGEELPRISG